MRRLMAVVLLVAGCGGEVSNSDEEVLTLGQTQHSIKAYVVANKYILSTRPKGTSLLADRVNLTLANNSILQTIRMSDVEQRILNPLTSAQPPVTCPYLTHTQGAGSPSCRYLLTRATDDSLSSSSSVSDPVDHEVQQHHSAELTENELVFVGGWVQQAILSGIDSGAAHTIALLREMKVCDQAPTPSESAQQLGESQGKALLETSEKAIVPVTPKTQCNTDLIASAVLSQAKSGVETFIQQNPLCAGFKPSDLAVAVDLTQAEKSRRDGIDEGLRQAYEALRVRLVSTWECESCTCVHRMSGSGAVQCVKGKHDAQEIRSVMSPHSPNSEMLTASMPMGNLVVVPKSQCSEVPINISSPLVLDLDGDGVRLSRSTVPFDLAATGDVARIPALEGADALLALDVDGNGRIDSGAELFGNATTCGAARCVDGVHALAQHDLDHDGRIDRRDPVYARLRLWRDRNRDGKSTTDELQGLAAAGIRALHVKARVAPWSDSWGNTSSLALSFERDDGSRGDMPDVWFNVVFDRPPRDLRAGGIVSTLQR